MEEDGKIINVPYMMSSERVGNRTDEAFVFNPDDFPGIELDDVADQIMLEEILKSHRAFWNIKPRALINHK